MVPEVVRGEDWSKALVGVSRYRLDVFSIGVEMLSSIGQQLDGGLVVDIGWIGLAV